MEELFAWTHYYVKIKKDFREFGIIQNKLRAVQKVINTRFPRKGKEKEEV